MPRAWVKGGDVGGAGYGMHRRAGWPRCSVLPKALNGILASARFHMHTSLLEGVSNRIKVI